LWLPGQSPVSFSEDKPAFAEPDLSGRSSLPGPVCRSHRPSLPTAGVHGVYGKSDPACIRIFSCFFSSPVLRRIPGKTLRNHYWSISFRSRTPQNPPNCSSAPVGTLKNPLPENRSCGYRTDVHPLPEETNRGFFFKIPLRKL